MNDLLTQWENEAIQLGTIFSGISLGKSTMLLQRKRILSLISLIRKQREALDYSLNNIGYIQDGSSAQKWKLKIEKVITLEPEEIK